jgi:hypothetical protein
VPSYGRATGLGYLLVRVQLNEKKKISPSFIIELFKAEEYEIRVSLTCKLFTKSSVFAGAHAGTWHVNQNLM